MPEYKLSSYYGQSDYKYTSEDDVPQASIQKYISERNKLKNPDDGFIDPSADTELREAMLMGQFDAAEEPGFDLGSYYGTEDDSESNLLMKDISDKIDFMDDLAGALSSGYRNMKAGVAGTGVILGAADKETAATSFVDAIRNQPETPEYYKRFLAKAEEEGRDVTEAEGIWDTTIESLDLVGELMLEAVTNPKGLTYTIAESAAQSLPSIGGGLAGAGIGTLVSPGVGTLVGFATGTGVGTFAVEAGGHLKGLVVENLQKQGRSLSDVNNEDIIAVFEDPDFMEWAESEAIKRGLAVSAVEGVFAAFGGKLISGVVGKSIFEKGARAAGDVGVETVGEMAGEFAGQAVTEGDFDPGSIAMEGIAGMGQSVGTSVAGAAIRAPMKAMKPTKPKDNLDMLFGEGTDDIAGDALDNLNTADKAAAEPTAEPTSYEQETTEAKALIDSYGDLTDAYASQEAQGTLEPFIIGKIYDEALATPHPQRTDGQKALVEMGRKAEAAAMSPIEKMREQSEEAVEIKLPEATAEEKAAVPDALKAASDRILEITDEQVTGETIETTEAQPAEVLEPVGLGEVQPDDAGDVPAGQPSSAAVQAEESAPLRTVDHVKSDIVNIEKATERGDNDTFEKAKASQSKMKELIAERDALIAAEIDVAANQAATSELNDLAQPTDAQKKAGDYKKGLVDVNGFGIAVENPKGSTRSGKDPSGKEWSVEMKDHYGEIQNTEGADGDNVDVFIGDNPESQKVFVVDQIDPSTGKFDEHKVIMGTNDAKQAKRTYKRNYAKGWKGDGAITEMTVDEFRTWVNFGDTTKPMTYKEVTTDESPSSAASIPDKRDTISNDKNMGRIDADKTAKPRTSIPVRKAVKSKIAEASTIAAAPVKAEQFKPAVAKKPSISVKKAVAKKVKEAAGPAVIVRPKVKDFETRDTFTVPAGTTLGIESKNLATQNFDKVTADDGYITYTRKTEDTSPETSTTTAGTATDIAGLDERSAPAADVSSDTTAGAANDISVQISEAVAPVEETAKTAKPVDTPTTERAAIPSEDKTKAAAPTEMRGGEPKGVTAESLVPEPSTLAEVVKKDVTTVLDFIKARTEVPALREIIDRIKDNLPVGLKIVTLQIGDKDPSQSGMQAARGLYQIDTNTIYLKGESFVENGMSEETIIHELLHAVTADLLRAGNLKANQGTDLANAVKELYALREQVVIEFNRKMKDGWKPQTNLANIATANVDELISWGLTNTDFQDLLMSMPSDKGSVWNSFVSAISKMLGISSENQNMLSELMIATDKLISADYRVDQAMREQLQVVRESSSYKVATKSLPQMEELELLQTQVAALQLDVETKSDITAGKKLKETNAKIELLQEEIQEARAEDPYFEIGEDDVDMQGDTLMGKPADRLTLRERLKSFFDNLKVMGGDIPDIMGRIVSSAYVIEKQERDTHGSRVTAEDSMTAAVHKSWNSKVAASMAIHEHGVSMENGTIVPDHTKPGLSQILEEVANHGERYLRRFEQYLLLQRSKELMTQDRENFVTQENIDVMDSWLDRNPNTKALFEKQHKAFQTWNKSTLDIAIASGWINQQDAYGGYMAFDADGNEVMNAGNTLFETEADALEAGDTATQVEGWYSDMYVPFYRIADDKGTKKPGASKRTAGDVAKAVKKLKGGEGQIPILENIVKNAEFIINGSMRTIAMQKIETEFRDSVMEEMDGVEIPGLINAAEMREEYRNIQEEAALEGEPVPKMGQAAAKRWAQMKSFARPTDTSTVVVYRNGRPTYYKVLDERLLTALKSIGAPQAKNWLNIIGMPTRLLQKSITIMPAFLARSFVRELQNAYIINREGGVNPLKTIGKGLKNFGKIATGDMAWMDEMMTGGFVNYNTYYNVTPDKLRQKLDKAGVKRSTFKNIVLSPWEGAKALGRIYMQIAVASEHASRKAVHDDFIKAGASKEEAMYQALDTMNFSRRSDYAAMEVLLATVPFLNPRIQGLDRLYRGMKEDWKPFALKAGLMAASATALALFNWEENEEEMSKLKDEDKAMNYHIFLDLGSGPKEHWRIPKGFEVGQITGTLPEFFIEQLYADQAEPASKAIRRFMTTTFGLQMPQFAAPAYAIATNEDPFRQRPIINYGQQFLLPSAQFDSWTSKLIVDISQSMPDSAPEWLRSPKKFEYLIKGYTGSSGAMILEGIDDIYRMTGNAPDLPTKKTSELYMVRDFYRTGSVSSSKQMDLFYEMVMETGKLASTLKAAKETSRSEYRAMRVEHADKLRARKSLNKYSKRMSAMSSEMRKLMLNDVISRDEKERRKDALTKRKNALAQKAVDRYFYIFD